MTALDYLIARLTTVLEPLVDDPSAYAGLIRQTQAAHFGDYQINAAMPLAKVLGSKPREIAQQLADGLAGDEFSKVEVAGPGFINLRFSDSFLVRQLESRWQSADHELTLTGNPGTIIVDYSSPNVAKPMHVGHLRSTVIGDAIARIHRALGWHVLADNHLGDWGLQFGMLIHGWRNFLDEAKLAESPIHELARLYKLVSKRADSDPAVERACQEETAKLHQGDPANLELWKKFMPWCSAELHKMYDRLGIKFDMELGESFYQPMLGEVVDSLVEKGIASESDGAICIFYPDPKGRTDDDGKPIWAMTPAIVRKSDGAFNYATSDLACIRYRMNQFAPRVMAYVVDDRQSLHFEQLFAAAERWGYGDVRMVHVKFGKILGKDGRPFKTRQSADSDQPPDPTAGGPIDLEALLDEAIARARRVIDENSPELDDAERARVAETIGLGAVKYADLSQNRTSDYVFDWDKMISLQGNTSTYLQYVYARNRSIFRKGNVEPASLDPARNTVSLAHESERALAIKILQFGESVRQSADDFKPNLLANYLFELANLYNGFFRDCPVLKAESDELRGSRLVLCELTARTIRKGLDLLGIDVVERM